jgi:hypothetical protein
MEVFTVRGLDRVSAEVRAAELRLDGYQADLVAARRRPGSYTIVYWKPETSADMACGVQFADACGVPFPDATSLRVIGH